MKSHLLDYILNPGSHPCTASFFFFLDQVANFKVLLDSSFFSAKRTDEYWGTKVKTGGKGDFTQKNLC